MKVMISALVFVLQLLFVSALKHGKVISYYIDFNDNNIFPHTVIPFTTKCTICIPDFPQPFLPGEPKDFLEDIDQSLTDAIDAYEVGNLGEHARREKMSMSIAVILEGKLIAYDLLGNIEKLGVVLEGLRNHLD